MKKLLYCAAALATVLFAASCQQEKLERVGNGTVTFTVTAPGDLNTRTIADGENVNQVHWAVYKTNSGEDYAIDDSGNIDGPLAYGTVEMFAKTATVELDLLQDQYYTILFWAQVAGKGHYVINDGDIRTVSVANTTIDANDESRAAFFRRFDFNTKSQQNYDDVKLYRPFSQINLGTTASSLVPSQSGETVGYTIEVKESSMTVSGLAKTFNLLEGKSPKDEAFEFTFTSEPTPATAGEVLKVNDVEYHYIAMNYLFVPAEEKLVNVTYDILTDKGNVNNSIGSVPVKENYRTNIIGNLLTSKTEFEIIVDKEFEKPDVNLEVFPVATAQELQAAIDEVPAGITGQIQLTDDINLADLLVTKASSNNQTLSIPNGTAIYLDLNGYSLTAVDETEKNYSVIDNRGDLTIVNSKKGTASKITVNAKVNSGWNRYSAVLANNPGGHLTVSTGVVIEHLGGTDMAYGIDNLTNGKGTYAVTVIDGATVKSPYRAVRQFLNGTEATNELYVKAGSVVEGENNGVFFHDPSKNPNSGKLVIEEGAQVNGVYLFVTEGSTQWPVEISIAKSAIGDKGLTSKNLPTGYSVVENDGVYTVDHSLTSENGVYTVYTVSGLEWVASQVNEGKNYFEGETVKLANDLDLGSVEWTPIGSAVMDHGFMGDFDGNGKTIRNLKMTALELDADGYVYAGLFGVTEGSATNENYIRNLTIENVDIQTTGHIVAAVIAYPYYTTVENITVKGNVNIAGGDYTSGVLAYTRRCVNAKNLTVEGNEGSSIEGNITVGGVISDIQLNGGLTADYSNFKAAGLTIKGDKCVGGISGIISNQTLDGATVENVTLVCDDITTGIVAGAVGGKSTLNNVSYENVTGATRVIGATYDGGYYFGQIIEVAGVKAVVYSVMDGVKAVSVEQGGEMTWDEAMAWAENLGEGWSLASIDDLKAIYGVRMELNDILAADDAANALFEEDNKEEDGTYAAYWSSTLVEGSTSKAYYLYFDNDASVKTSFTMFLVEYSRAVYNLAK